jgi:hypothetical protein
LHYISHPPSFLVLALHQPSSILELSLPSSSPVTKHKSQTSLNCHRKLVERGPHHLPASPRLRRIPLAAAVPPPYATLTSINQPPTRSPPPQSSHPSSRARRATSGRGILSSPTSQPSPSPRTSLGRQPVLFPRPGQLALPLRAFLATTWTVAVASPPHPLSVSLSFGLSPGPSLFLPFAFPPPACLPLPRRSAAKQSWRRGGFVPDLRPVVRRCPPRFCH